MNTTAQIARLRAQAEELQALSHDKFAEANRLENLWGGNHAGWAVSARERAINYLVDADKAERENG